MARNTGPSNAEMWVVLIVGMILVIATLFIPWPKL